MLVGRRVAEAQITVVLRQREQMLRDALAVPGAERMDGHEDRRRPVLVCTLARGRVRTAVDRGQCAGVGKMLHCSNISVSRKTCGQCATVFAEAQGQWWAKQKKQSDFGTAMRL